MSTVLHALTDLEIELSAADFVITFSAVLRLDCPSTRSRRSRKARQKITVGGLGLDILHSSGSCLRKAGVQESWSCSMGVVAEADFARTPGRTLASPSESLEPWGVACVCPDTDEFVLQRARHRGPCQSRTRRCSQGHGGQGRSRRRRGNCHRIRSVCLRAHIQIFVFRFSAES